MSRNVPLTVRLNRADNVVVARTPIPAGTAIAEEGITCRQLVPAGHKVATTGIAEGQPVFKYGQIIGFATQTIAPGDHVHTHNLEMRDFGRDYAMGQDTRPTQYVPEGERASFQGIVRADGRVATRNYIGVLSTVNCSASVVRYIADVFRGGELAAYGNVDGIVPIVHGMGCATDIHGEGLRLLRRTLAGYARNPNMAAVLFVGLGCETNLIDTLLEEEHLEHGPLLHGLNIQDVGGSVAAVREGVAWIRGVLPAVNDVRRETVPASKLLLGIECGGSDGYSGITANPAMGAAADELVRQGGTAILGETPEIFGAEHLLTRRAVSPAVGQKIVDLIHWWEEYTAREGGEMDNNPSPGNKEGGLTTILEKSLGAVSKAGTTNLVDVYQFAETVTAQGMTFMNTPGYDAPSVAGMVAGGANLVCFTTGRGSVFGCKPVPVIKLATNTALYEHMKDDMDVNCGTIVDGEETIEEAGQRIFRLMLEVASGARTRSEIHGIGADEFVPWSLGAVM